MAKAGSGKKKMMAVRKKRSNATKSSLRKTGKSVLGPMKKVLKKLMK